MGKGDKMILPKQLETIRERKIWVNYPMIWEKGGHDGQGSYRKPPINPYTLRNANPTDSSTWSDFDKANSNIGKTALFTDKDGNVIECTVHGVGIALYNSGVFGLDLDSVIRVEPDGKRFMTREAHDIITELGTYVEISPSKTGLHVLCLGKIDIPNVRYSASGKRSISNPNYTTSGKFEIYKSGKYLTVTGEYLYDYSLKDCTESFKETYKKHFVTEKNTVPSVVSSSGASVAANYNGSGSSYLRELWKERLRYSTYDQILDGIFKSGSIGRRVKKLFDGDMSDYNNGHSEADQALVSYFYCFTCDDKLTCELFERSALCREKWTSREDYRARTLNRARMGYYPLIGHIEFTDEEKKAYAQKKEYEEDLKEARRLGYESVEAYRDALTKSIKESLRKARVKRETVSDIRGRKRGGNYDRRKI